MSPERKNMRKKKMSATSWMVKTYMTHAHIETFTDLAAETGIEYRTLMNRLDEVGMLRVYEIRQLDDVLHFSSKDLLALIKKGDGYEQKVNPVYIGNNAPELVAPLTLVENC